MQQAPIDAKTIVNSCRSRPGLYIHVPFCRSICPFCPYNKVIYREQLARRYFAALSREVDQYLACVEAPFSSLYIGGGTPTLCLNELDTLIKRIPVSGERAIEVLPSHAGKQTVATMRAMGITYVSLGVQSFDHGMLRYLRRPHTVADNYCALEHTLGQFECVDVDLIFDVAFQDGAVFLHDARTCFEYGVDQLSTYPLMRFGYTLFGKAKHDRRREHEILSAVEALAADYGYERRSVWTFNKHRSPSYTSITREFYIGVGAGSATYTGRYFLLNYFSVAQYIAAVRAGNLPLARWIPLGTLKAAAYYLFWQAYTGAIDLQAYADLFPEAWILQVFLRALARTDYIDLKDGVVVLTADGYDLYHDLERWVTYHFIEPLWEEMMQEYPWMAASANARKRLNRRIWLSLIGAKPV